MPGKYAEIYDAPWEDVASVNMQWSSSLVSGQTVGFSVPSNALLYVYKRILKKKGQIFFMLGDKIHYFS